VLRRDPRFFEGDGFSGTLTLKVVPSGEVRFHLHVSAVVLKEFFVATVNYPMPFHFL